MNVIKPLSPASAGAGPIVRESTSNPKVSRATLLYDVIRFVRPLHLALARSVERGLHGTGVTMAMRAVLEIIDAGGPKSVPDIGRVLVVERQSAQRIVNAAQELELVELISNPAHRRSPLVSLTPKGAELFAYIREQEQKTLQRIGRNSSRDDIEATIRVLNALTLNFQEIAAGRHDD